MSRSAGDRRFPAVFGYVRFEVIISGEEKILKKWREIMQPYMKRPMLYMAFTRFVLALAAVLLTDHFLSPAAGRPLLSTVFLLAAFVFALRSWIAYLRLDGMHLPKILMLRLDPRKKPSRMNADMIDFVDEQPGIDFSDLDDTEKDICILAADLFCFLAFLAAGLLV